MFVGVYLFCEHVGVVSCLSYDTVEILDLLAISFHFVQEVECGKLILGKIF